MNKRHECYILPAYFMEGNNSLNTAAQPNLSGAVAQELDFYRIRSTIAALAASDEGKELLLAREPSSDAQQAGRLKALGREWGSYLHSHRPQALLPFPPVAGLFAYLGKEGAQLEQDQVFALGIFCNALTRAQESLASAAEGLPLPGLAAIAAGMPQLAEARREIFSIITADGEVKDLPQLRAIRTKIAALHKEIEGTIRRYTSDPQLSGALQSTVPAFKAERELLAVRSDRRGAIHGIVHEVSASGQTVYIEPDEIVRANNELIQLEFEYQSELRKIFRELTARLGEWREDFAAAHAAMLLLDATCAAARWQSHVHGVFAEDCDLALEPPAIRGARHPLLGDKAVPVDICFMDGKKVLIITGPNTGGKTVTLKTIALFALLNQAGFPVPAEEGTRLPVFSSVFADIGDEQSIDESLSTFSAHMKKIAQMVNEADSRSLILLDELGSGTDPQEGGAIAMAALDVLIARGSFVIVTTHHGILKNYGYSNKRCVNASVEFDTGTLRPTYRLLMGVPGESHAIDIARRSGLPEHVVAKARSYIASEQADVSTLIKGLTAKHAELDARMQEEQARSAELEEKEHKLHGREIRAKEKELELKELERAKSSEFLREMRKKLENLVRELREGEITREKTLSVKQFIASAEESVALQDDFLEAEKRQLAEEKEREQQEEVRLAENGMRLSRGSAHAGSSKKKGRHRLSNAEALATASVPAASASAVGSAARQKPQAAPVKLLFAPGTEVFAGAERRRGTLVSQNKNGSWNVQFGSLKMAVPQTQLVPVSPSTVPAAASVVIETGSDGQESESRPRFELRLLGMRYEEAMKALEKQLDLCTIYRFREFSVIHGKGSGILQQGVQNYLSHYPGVKEFHFAQPEDGGTGKTYVSLY